MNSSKKVIGIILAYKAASSLDALYRSLPMGVLDEVIISNDDTGDGIEKIAEKIGIKCFSHPRLGYGGNMKYGIKKAIELGADYIAEIHGDGQYDPSYIGPALAKIKEDDKYGLVIGSRFVDIRQPLRDGMPLLRYCANIFLTTFDRIILGVKVSELHTGARVYNVEALKQIDPQSSSNDFLYSFEIIAQIVYKKFKIGEVPVRCYYTKEHTSISIKRSFVYAFETIGTLYYFVLAKFGIKSKLFK